MNVVVNVNRQCDVVFVCESQYLFESVNGEKCALM
jgi:hypothetical protein